MSTRSHLKRKLFHVLITIVVTATSLPLTSSGVIVRADNNHPAMWKFLYNPPVVGLFSGSATYNYPLELPPGRGGLQPSVNFSYNSSRVNGLLGYLNIDAGPLGLGWSVDQIDITRRATAWKTCVTRNNKPCYKDRFVLAMNGTSYDLEPATDAQVGRFYAKDAPGLYVERHNDKAGNGTPVGINATGDYWIVRTPDGTTYRLGYTYNSEQVVRGVVSNGGYYSDREGETTAVKRWRVDRVRDVHGNVMRFAYQEFVHNDSDKWSLLKEIKYNKGDGVFLSWVKFINNGNDEGVGPLYDKIQVFDRVADGTPDTELVREYRLDVNTNSLFECGITLNQAHLDQVRVYEPGGQALPPTTFTYEWLGNWTSDCYHYPRMKRVENGYGGKSEFSYVGDGYKWAHSTCPVPSAYNPCPNLDPDAVGQSYEVTEMRTYDGINPSPARVTYEYANACRGVKGSVCAAPGARGHEPITGYGTVTERAYDYDSSLAGMSTHKFKLEYDLLGREYRTQQKDTDGTVLRKTETSFSIRPFGPTHFVAMDQVVSTDFTGGEAISTRATYEYDGYGNVVGVNQMDENDELYRRTERAYVHNHDPSVWIVNKPALEEVYDGEGNLLAATLYGYDGGLSPADGVGEKGELTLMRRRTLAGSESDETIDAAYAYDAYGNVVTETVYTTPGTVSAATPSPTTEWIVPKELGWKRYEGNPVMSYGEYSWDSKRVTQPSVIYDGGIYHMWYGALDDGNVWRIGYATSPDGVTWTKRSTPVLQPQSGTFYADGINAPSVIKSGDGYVMWFSGTSGSATTIGRAESSDGITWTSIQQVLAAADVAWVSGDEMVANPTILVKDGGYHMWFHGGTWDDMQIGYAHSDDGVNWIPYTAPVLENGTAGSWDDTAAWAPVVWWSGEAYHMWYVGKADPGWASVNHIGHATSSNGIDWTKDARNPVLKGFDDDSWQRKLVGVEVVQAGGELWMWYAGAASGGYQSIGLATAPLVSDWHRYEGSPVLENGGTGEWDSQRATQPAILYDGETYHMWYTGLDQLGAEGTWQIGYATSPDGIVWTKSGDNPVIALQGGYADGTQGSSVVKNGPAYEMYFAGLSGTTWSIWKATSNDGVNWTGIQQVLTSAQVDWADGSEGIGHPNVVNVDGTYHMWFSGHTAAGERQIGHAVLQSGTWVADDDPVLTAEEAWEALELLSPEVMWDGEGFHMWYTGKGTFDGANYYQIGYASSPDGITWTKYAQNPILKAPKDGSWQHNATSVAVLRAGHEFRMWYSGGYGGVQKIGLATMPAIPWAGGPAGGSSPEFRTSTIEYDDTYHMYPVETCSPEVDGVGRLCTTIEYYGVETVPADDGLPGQVKSITDPNGATTSYKYDDFGRLIETFLPLQQGSGIPSITYHYADTASPFKIRVWQLKVSDPDPSCYGNAECYYASHTYYDGLGREIEQKYYMEGDLVAMAATKHNALGQVARQGLPYEATTSAWTYEAPDWTRPHTAYEYDPMGRPVRIENPDGAYTHTIYEGLTTTAIDANGHQKRYTNDVWGQLVKAEEFAGESRLFWEVEAGASWQRYASNPVLSYGSYSWDAKRVTQPSVIYDGETYRMWYGALDDGNVWRIGYATSPDGKTWTKRSTPVLQPQVGTFYADGINNPSVVKTGDEYVMWFSGTSGDVTTIGRAESLDGINWSNVQQVLTPEDVDWVSTGEIVSNAEVVLKGDGYHMWFQGGTWDDMQIGYAYSIDGIDWEVRSTPVLEQGPSGSWDDTAVWAPAVVWDGGQYHMWYVGKADPGWTSVNHIGYTTSPDGITWTKDAGNPVLEGYDDGSWQSKVVESTVVRVGDQFKMWYAGANGGYQKIGLATTPIALGEESNASLYATTEYAYDTLGHLTAVTDTAVVPSGGNVTTMEYDTLGRKVAMDDPDMGHWTYNYDLLGNLTSQTDARGCEIGFVYDPLNRLTDKTYAGCAGSPGAVHYTYDQGTNGLGRLSRMDDPSGWTEYSYDDQGRTIKEWKHVNDGGTFETHWTYDPMDRVTSITYPNGEVVPYTYEGPTLESVGPYVQSIAYNPLGQITSMTYGNDVTTQYAYHPLNFRLERVLVSGHSQGMPLLDLGYTYDPVGNVTTISDQVVGQTQHFEYDHLDRLTHAWTTGGTDGAYDRTYAYDAIGNITYKSDVGSYTYQDPLHVHAVTHIDGVQRYAYDTNGNMTQRDRDGDGTYDQALTFNAENKVQRVTEGSEETTFTYDGNGARVKKVDSSSGTTYYVGGLYEKMEAGGVVTTTSYYYAGGQRVAMRTTVGVSTTVTYLHGDHLGSTSLTTDAAGALVARVLYYPYGETRYTEGTLPTDYGYTGQRNEAGLGLMDYNARYYDPALGRFVSADTIVPGAAEGAGGGLATIGYSDQMRLTPLTVGFHEPQFLEVLNAENQELLEFGPPALWDSRTRQEHNVPMGPANPQGLNRYAYCLNNPLRYLDPTGHEEVATVELTLEELQAWIDAIQQLRDGLTDATMVLEGLGVALDILGLGILALGVTAPIGGYVLAGGITLNLSGIGVAICNAQLDRLQRYLQKSLDAAKETGATKVSFDITYDSSSPLGIGIKASNLADTQQVRLLFAPILALYTLCESIEIHRTYLPMVYAQYD